MSCVAMTTSNCAQHRQRNKVTLVQDDRRSLQHMTTVYHRLHLDSFRAVLEQKTPWLLFCKGSNIGSLDDSRADSTRATSATTRDASASELCFLSCEFHSVGLIPSLDETERAKQRELGKDGKFAHARAPKGARQCNPQDLLPS